jgi:nitroreductase
LKSAGPPVLTPIESLLTRSSLAGAFLGPPAPNAAQLREILGAAQRAADHGRLRPWRFFVVRPAQYAAFYDRLAAAAARGQGDPARVEANREKYRLTERAPLLIVAAAQLTRDHKIAEIEQLFAAAGATQLVLSAAHALGFSAFLFSGKGVFDATLKADFGLTPADHLIGFICIGMPTSDKRALVDLPANVQQGIDATAVEWLAPTEFRPLD